MRKVLLLLLLFVFLFTSCTTTETTSDINARLEANNREWEFEKTALYNATLNHYFFGLTNDEILEYLGQHKEEITKNWTISHYVDSFGDPTDQAYARLQTEGHFSNSATRRDTIEVIFLVDENSFSFKLYEYGLYLVSGDLYVDIKDEDTNEQTTLDILTFSDRYQVARVYQSEEEIRYWKEMMEAFGFVYSNYFDILNMISDGGVIKFSAHDNYFSNYNWECNTDNLAILLCAIWMNAGEIENMGWYDALF